MLVARLALFAALLASPAAAQETPPTSVPFEGGTLAIAETPDFEKVLTFDGKELARAFVVFYDRTIELGGVNVALFDVGDGGNACGPATLIVWKPEGGEIETVTAGDDCGAPPAAATADALYFVPYLIPGASKDVQVWSPENGLAIAGRIAFVPQPGTGWADFQPGDLGNIVEAFDNEAVYAAGADLLGDDLESFSTGLLTGGGIEATPSGIAYARGCVPHACGISDAFMAIDAKGRKLYLAQQDDGAEPKAWPSLSTWPAEVADAMKAALVRPR